VSSSQPAIGNRPPSIQSILVIKPSSLGDVVHTLPAVALLKRHWPGSRLTWLVNPEWAPLLEGNPYVDEVVIFPRGKFRGLTGWTKIPAWAKETASKKADLVVDFQGLLRSALIGRLCRGGELAGLSDAREGARFFYDRVAEVSGVRHAVDRYLRLVAELGVPVSGDLEWPLPAGTAPIGVDFSEPFVLLHPFSRGEGKSLTAPQVREFCVAMAPMRVVLAGRAAEKIDPVENVTNLLNRTTLAELIWLIRRAAFTVSVDSGPMHIAAGITRSLLSIHTWSDPAKVGPYQPEAWVWKSGALFQMRDLGKSTAHRPCREVRDVAAWVKQTLQIAPRAVPSSGGR
jgi:ADP-heptose:LPS heptosyltransferase